MSAPASSVPPLNLTADEIQFLHNVTDPALHSARLHDLFVKAVFGNGDVPSDDDASQASGSEDGDEGAAAGEDILDIAARDEGDDELAAQGIRTAAEIRRQEELRAELADLTGEVNAEDEAAAAAGDDILDFDRISEEDEEERQREQQELRRRGGGGNGGFTEWANFEHDSDEDDGEEEEVADVTAEDLPVAAAGDVPVAEDVQTKKTQQDIEQILIGLGLGSTTASVVNSPLPERFHQLAVEQRRPMFGGCRDPVTGAEFVLDKTQEAFWILKQLIKPGQPLFSNSNLRQAVDKLQKDQWDYLQDNRNSERGKKAPIELDTKVASIKHALELMTEKFLEPAHLMIYHTSELMVLVDLLWHDEALRKYSTTEPNCSFAVCSKTGRRLQPYFKMDSTNEKGGNEYIGFEPIVSRTDKLIGSGDKAWGDLAALPGSADDDGSVMQNASIGALTIRKPAIMELGRLLWTILDLDAQCHALEGARGRCLMKMNAVRMQLINLPPQLGGGSQNAASSSSSSTGASAASSAALAAVTMCMQILEGWDMEEWFDGPSWNELASLLSSGLTAARKAGQLGGANTQQASQLLALADDLQNIHAAAMGSATFPRSLSSTSMNGNAAGAHNVGVTSAGHQTARLQQLGIFDTIMSQYAIHPLEVQENCLRFAVGGSRHSRLKTTTCPQKCTMTPEAWFATSLLPELKRRGQQLEESVRGTGAEANAARQTARNLIAFVNATSAKQLHETVKSAFIESVAALPKLRRAIYDAFVQYGHCTVTPVATNNSATSGNGNTSTKVISIPIRSLLFSEDGALSLLPYFELEHLNRVNLAVTVSSDALEKAIPFEDILTEVAVVSRSREEDAWEDEMERLIPQILKKLFSFTAKIIMQGLRQTTENALLTQCVKSFSFMACEGNWEPTMAAVDAYGGPTATTTQMVWDEALNVVESLPVSMVHTQKLTGHSSLKNGLPICGVFRSDITKVSYFEIIDVFGNRQGACQWRNYPTNTAEGKVEWETQKATLRYLLDQFEVEVIGLVANGVESAELLNTIQRMLREDVENSALTQLPNGTQPPKPQVRTVVWVAPNLLRVHCQCPSLKALAGREDYPEPGLMALSAALYLQDPLLLLAQCLHSESSALMLPFGRTIPSNASPHFKKKLYAALEREMSLWITAEGLDVNRLFLSAHPEEYLRFVSGLGKLKAAHLTNAVNRFRGGALRSRMDLFVVAKEVVGGKQDYVSINCSSALRIRFDLQSPLEHIQAGDEKAKQALSEIDVDPQTGEATCTAFCPDGLRFLWCPLDETMLPLAWYDIAAKLAHRAYDSGMNSPGSLVGLFYQMGTFAERANELHQQLSELEVRAYANDYADEVRRQQKFLDEDMATAEGRASIVKRNSDDEKGFEYDNSSLAARLGIRFQLTYLGKRETDFIIDELSHAWEPHMRRSFRPLTSRRLFKCLTGVTFVNNNNRLKKRNDDNNGSPSYNVMKPVGAMGEEGSLTLTTDDLVQGIIKSVQTSDMVKGLKITTTMGVNGFMDARDISNPEIVQAIEDYAEARRKIKDAKMEEENAAAGTGVPVVKKGFIAAEIPAIIAAGTPVFGCITGATMSKGELRLKWVPPTVAALQFPSSSSVEERGGSAAVPADDTSVANTLATRHFLREAMPHMLAAAEFQLFRDCTTTLAEELLARETVGECLIVPGTVSHQGHLNRIIVVYKIGARNFAHLHMQEFRQPDGRARYRLYLPWSQSRPEFPSLDHFLSMYIGKVTDHVKQLKDFPKFFPTWGNIEDDFAIAKPGQLRFAISEADTTIFPIERGQPFQYYLYYKWIGHETCVCHRQPIGITPEGFVVVQKKEGMAGMQYQVFDNVTALYNFLKRMIMKQYEAVADSRAPVLARR